jgi:3-oxoacyl-[acyl-carrier protein] reductase
MSQLAKQFDLAGKAALVTGAGVGIGRATALALAEAGAFVGIHYNRSAAEAEAVLAALKAGGGDGLLIQADLTREDEANALVATFVEGAGRMDILVNNAGALVGRATTEDSSLELWNATLAANVTSAFLVTRKSIPHLRASGNGSIVNICSLSMQSGGTNGAGAYAVAKGALHIFTRTLARELGPEVRSNAICPGVIETRHHEGSTSPERLAQYRQDTPLKRNGTAEEVAAAVLYLASDASSFSNGALLDVGGGRFMR